MTFASSPKLSALTLMAPAKLNLALSVSAPISVPGPRAGFHAIASWMVPISLCDEVHFAPGGASMKPAERFGVWWCEDAPKPTLIDWPIEKDLGFRALTLIEKLCGGALPVIISLRKRIPTGGGLGGGSSDAAAVLMGLNRLFKLNLSHEQLLSVAVTLGSDVAFFIDEFNYVSGIETTPRGALVTGFGERIKRVPLADNLLHSRVCVIIPPYACPTGAVYRAFDGFVSLTPRKEADDGRVRQLMTHSSGVFPAEELFNDLAHAACAVAPQLGAMHANLQGYFGRPIHITGSGSCMFMMGLGNAVGVETEGSIVAACAAQGCAAVWTNFIAPGVC